MGEIDGLAERIRSWAAELGFQQVGIAAPDLARAGERLREWLARGYHADMDWLAEQQDNLARPDRLVPGTLRVISARMDYWREDAGRLAADRFGLHLLYVPCNPAERSAPTALADQGYGDDSTVSPELSVANMHKGKGSAKDQDMRRGGDRKGRPDRNRFVRHDSFRTEGRAPP